MARASPKLARYANRGAWGGASRTPPLSQLLIGVPREIKPGEQPVAMTPAWAYAVVEGVYYLGKAHGGRGILVSGVPGDPPGNVVILGAGTVGLNAARTAIGLGADVSILDVNLDRLRHCDEIFRGQIVTVASNAFNITQVVQRADLLIGGVLIAGARAPVLVTRAMVERMKEGAVVVDVAVDQGGCIETIHPTTLL